MASRSLAAVMMAVAIIAVLMLLGSLLPAGVARGVLFASFPILGALLVVLFSAFLRRRAARVAPGRKGRIAEALSLIALGVLAAYGSYFAGHAVSQPALRWLYVLVLPALWAILILLRIVRLAGGPQ